MHSEFGKTESIKFTSANIEWRITEFSFVYDRFGNPSYGGFYLLGNGDSYTLIRTYKIWYIAFESLQVRYGKNHLLWLWVNVHARMEEETWQTGKHVQTQHASERIYTITQYLSCWKWSNYSRKRKQQCAQYKQRYAFKRSLSLSPYILHVCFWIRWLLLRYLFTFVFNRSNSAGRTRIWTRIHSSARRTP